MGETFLIKEKKKGKMKLIAASVIALAAAEERAFADKNDFITQQEPFWYQRWWQIGDKPAEYIANTEMAISYFAKHVESNPRFQSKLAQNLNSLVTLEKNLNDECAKRGKPEYAKLTEAAAGRKRRSGSNIPQTGYDYGHQQGQEAFSSNVVQNVNAFFWQAAKWARNEMEADCPDYAWRIYKKADRLRLITMNNWCRAFDSTADFCSWAHKNNQGEVIKELRKRNWFNNKYGKDLAKEDSQYL